MTETPGNVVAVIDDDPAVLESIKFLLEVVGYTVTTYNSARAFLANSPAHARCLILDHHMPDMTGLELAGVLRGANNMMPILLVTGSPSPAIVARAADLGVERVLEKPPAEDDVIRFVESHLG